MFVISISFRLHRYILQKLRARLVPVLKFTTIQAGRTVVKENDFPIFVYFVISGEIEMKKTIFDRVSLSTFGEELLQVFLIFLQSTKKTSMISEAIIGPGDWIGDVELLENCPRLYTYVTTCMLKKKNPSLFFLLMSNFCSYL